MSWLDAFNARGPGRHLDTGQVWVNVAGGVALSPGQFNAVAYEFEQHKQQLRNSLAGYLEAEYTLPDGSRMHVRSNSGQHHVTVWPARAERVSELAHGFAVRSNWVSRPLIYARASDGTWSWKEGAPQVVRDTPGYEQVLRPTDRIVLPLVLNVPDKLGWDWEAHQGYKAAVAAGSWIMPVNLIVQGQQYQAHRSHFALNDTLVKADGTELYAVGASDAILLVDPEDQEPMPGTSDSSGEQCALQHWRRAMLTTGIWKFRFCNEVLHRSGLEVYAQLERNVVDVVTPLPEVTTTTTNINDGTLGESFASGEVFQNYTTYTHFSSPPDAAWGYVLNQAVHTTTTTEVAGRELIEQDPGAPAITSKLIAVGGNSSIQHVTLENRLDYIRSVAWRMGTVTNGYPKTSIVGSYDRWGVFRKSKIRKEMKYWIDGTPDVRLNLGWSSSYKILEGTTTGRQDGYYAADTVTHFGWFDIINNRTGGIYVTQPFDPAPDLRPMLLETYAVPYDTGGVGASEETNTEVLEDTRPTNSGSYDLTSRHVIDYDHRGRFIAAIRVRVTCSGAVWTENRAVHDGFMAASGSPTYTVEVALETNWNGLVAATVLCTAAGTHPAWEFVTLAKANPYYYPPTLADGAAGRDIFNVRVPPVVKPADDAVRQAFNLAAHQGVNPHIACQDIRSDLTSEVADQIDSPAGIEYSLGDDRPHTRRVTGQLYARSFNIANDFPEALWLLGATKVSAKQNDGETGDAYFYFAGLKAALELNRHIEVRDGVHVQWSDTLGAAESRPAATARELELFQV